MFTIFYEDSLQLVGQCVLLSWISYLYIIYYFFRGRYGERVAVEGRGVLAGKNRALKKYIILPLLMLKEAS
jgi:hypothetical protein